MKTFILSEEGCDFDRVEAETAEAALYNFEYEFDTLGYNVSEKTIWIHLRARNVDDRYDSASRKVRIDPDEPKCSNGKHDWQSPHAIVGGLRENPGVWGHGAGLIICEVCMHCGCGKTTDTWAQDPSDGEQGLESVRYEPGKYAVADGFDSGWDEQ